MDATTGRAESYWLESTESPSYPSSTEHLAVDVAVVGGGIAGVCAAWEAARGGRSVALLEADRILAGTTGHTTGKLTALHGLVYAYLRSTFDPTTARLYAQSQSAAVQHVFDTARALGIHCELERLPATTYVTEEQATHEIRAEVEAARDAGLAASYTTETGLPFAVAAAIRVEGQAQFHPRKYLLGLAEDLTRRGGQIFEQTRVTELHDGDPCRLTTESGVTVEARDVVIATGYPVFDRGLLFARLKPRREMVVAARIPAEADPRGMYLTREHDTRSVRSAPQADGRRLLIVTGESFTPGAADVTDRLTTLADWTRATFDVSSLAYHWSAQDAVSTDRIPFIGLLHAGTRHVYVATGFNAWGMSNGVLAGQLITALLDGQPPAWASLYDPRRLHATAEARSFVSANLAVARHFIGDRLRSHAASPAGLAPGTGAILWYEGRHSAVYRDDDGHLHAVSATCTHLGCLVAFNQTERTWDCPCHGSRFDTDGTVLRGPATHPLKQRPTPADE